MPAKSKAKKEHKAKPRRPTGQARAARAQHKEKRKTRRLARQHPGGANKKAESRVTTQSAKNAYTLSGPPVSVGTVNQSPARQPLHIRFTEFVGDVDTTKAFESVSFLNMPTNKELYPWLSRIAQYGTTYQWEYAKLRYSPQTATDVAGTVAILNDPDPERPPQSDMKAMINHVGTGYGPPYANNVTQALFKSNEAIKRKFIDKFEDVAMLGGSFTEDLHTIADGVIQVATAGLKSLFAGGTRTASAASADDEERLTTGKLFVDYGIKIFDPVTNFDDEPQYIAIDLPLRTALPFADNLQCFGFGSSDVDGDPRPGPGLTVLYADPDSLEEWDNSPGDQADTKDGTWVTGVEVGDTTKASTWIDMRSMHPGTYVVTLMGVITQDVGVDPDDSSLFVGLTGGDLFTITGDAEITDTNVNATDLLVKFTFTKSWRVVVPDGLEEEEDVEDTQIKVFIQETNDAAETWTTYAGFLTVTRIASSGVALISPDHHRAHARRVKGSGPVPSTLNKLFFRNLAHRKTAAMREGIQRMNVLNAGSRGRVRPDEKDDVAALVARIAALEKSAGVRHGDEKYPAAAQARRARVAKQDIELKAAAYMEKIRPAWRAAAGENSTVIPPSGAPQPCPPPPTPPASTASGGAVEPAALASVAQRFQQGAAPQPPPPSPTGPLGTDFVVVGAPKQSAAQPATAPAMGPKTATFATVAGSVKSQQRSRSSGHAART